MGGRNPLFWADVREQRALIPKPSAHPNSPAESIWKSKSLSIRSGQVFSKLLKRLKPVIDLLNDGRLLDLHETAAAAIGNASLGNLIIRDGVFLGYVLRTHDSGNCQQTQLII